MKKLKVVFALSVMNKTITILMIAMMLTAVFTGCTRQSTSQNNELTIVFESSGERIPFAWVQIFQNGKQLQMKQADSTGLLKLNLKKGVYSFIFSDGFLTGRADIKVPNKSHLLQLEPTEVQKGKIGFVKRLREGVIKTVLLIEEMVQIVEFKTNRLIQSEGKIWEINGELNSYVFVSIVSKQVTTGYREIAAFDYDIKLNGYRTVDATGNILFQSESYFEAANEREEFASNDLAKVGDICRGKTMQVGTDGIIDIWDLILLLKKFGSTDGLADIANEKTTLVLPPKAPFEHNLETEGPDGIVDIWDLIFLLKGYGATIDLINKPFSPNFTRIKDNDNDSFLVYWDIQFEKDCFEEFVFFTTDSTETFVPSVSSPFYKKTVGKNTRFTEISELSKYLVLCAKNGEYFSKPTFFNIDKFINSRLFDFSAYVNYFDSTLSQLHYNITFDNLPPDAESIELTGGLDTYTLPVSLGKAHIDEYVTELEATSCTIHCYSDAGLIFDEQIYLPQPLELDSVVPEYETPLFSSYIVTVKVNYDAINSFVDFNELDVGVFLGFRDLRDTDLDFVAVSFDAGKHIVTMLFKMFVLDHTTTSGILKTNTEFELRIDLQ